MIYYKYIKIIFFIINIIVIILIKNKKINNVISMREIIYLCENLSEFIKKVSNKSEVI